MDHENDPAAKKDEAVSSKPDPAPLPSRDEILAFLKTADGKITKREIARAFNVRGPDKVLLKKMLREMAEDGLIAKDAARALRPADRLPGVQVVEFAGLDDHGDVLVRPAGWKDEAAPPRIYLDERRRGRGKGPRVSAMGPGDRALARLIPIDDGGTRYRAHVLKRLESLPDDILGIFHGGSGGGRLHAIDKKNRDDYLIAEGDTGGAVEGELVLAQPVGRGRRRGSGPRMARVSERLGDVTAARSISLIAIHAHDIPHVFPDDVLNQAKAVTPPPVGARTDLRAIPLITIDPADARDHDDAIFAEADNDPGNPGGWHIIVAIADVAHYVSPGSALDCEARKRGNSCYFPDRVVPMLPEELSAGLCSLKPGEDRAAMVVHIWLDAQGHKRRHRFERAMINSHANLTYTQAQRALDGMVDEAAGPLLDSVLKPLEGAFGALMAARERRQPLDLDMPERRIELDDAGRVTAIALRERLTTHRIVEEFMILANVCAAETLEKHRMPHLYRIHEEPPMDKLETLRDFLSTLDLSLTRGAVMQPRLFNGILTQVEGSPHERLVNEVVLRSQTQAYYGADNRGHFGLALPRYSHFTSPIRRYADLIVHRGLIRALKLGKDGLTDDEMENLDDTGEHISATERRAMAAERDSTDRYLAAYLTDRVGQTFKGRISGVSRHGLFVALEPSGGDGLVPISTLGQDYYRLDEPRHSLVGENYGEEFRLGDAVDVKLLEANRFTGGLRLELVGDRDLPAFISGKPNRRPRQRSAGAYDKNTKPGKRRSKARR